jgi:hypothetical protein
VNPALKWKLVAGFALVFAAGVSVGAFLGTTRWPHTAHALGSHRPLAERMRSRVQTRLRLTPEQVAKAKPIFDKTAEAIGQIRKETAQRVHAVLAEAERELAPALTPDQRARLEASPAETR